MSENNINLTEDNEKETELETETEEEITEEKTTEKKSGSPKHSAEKDKLSRKTKHRIISITTICLVIIAAVLLNVISSVLTDKFVGLTADITSNGSFELSEDSVKIAESLNKKVSITFLTDKTSYEAYDTYCKQATNIADRLKKYSNGFISVEYVDLVQNPNLESKYQDETLAVTDVIVQSGDKYNLLKVEDMFNFEVYGDYQYITSSKAESAFDTAIVKVTSDVETKVAIITDNAEDSYSTLETVLTSNNYILSPISIESDDIPDDVNTVIAWAPTEDYSEKAIEKIQTFLKNDGKYDKSLIFVAYRYEIECPNITALLSEYGMQLEDGLAFETDTTRMMTQNDAYRTIAAGFGADQYISNYTDSDLPVLVSMSRAVTLTDENSVGLLQYSSQSGVCPYDADDNWSWQDYVTGYVNVMAQGYSGGDEGISRLIFAGSTEMWNSLLTQPEFTNKKYIFNILNDLNHREDNAVYLDNKIITEYDLSAVSSNTASVTGVIMYAVIPILILGAGLCVFIVRRRK